MRWLYSLSIRAYSGIVSLVSPWNVKAKQWIKGRDNQWNNLKPEDDKSEWIWFHASSLGEFEQGRPVIEAIKERFPKYKILLTFFSPSGYEIRKNYQFADKIAYMPSDTVCNAKKLIRNFKFKMAVFIKYEFWFNYMKVLKDNKIPLYYISVRLRPTQHFFKSYGTWFRKQLKNVDYFFVQDQNTARLLESIDYKNVTVNGDTRFDRVATIARQANKFPIIENFIDGRKCIVAGSTWQPDENLFYNFIEKLPDDYCLILAPHNIADAHIEQITSQLKTAFVLFTSLENESKKSKILVLNTIGILSQLYQYAQFAYVGGGFGVNIHNIQEAVTFGCPVVFGPKYKNFNEAVDLVRLNGAFSVANQQEFDSIFEKLISDNSFRQKTSEICKQYVDSQLGATDVIMSFLEKKL